MKKVLLIGVILLVAIGCRGYKEKKHEPMSPEELKVSDLAQQLESQSEQLNSEKFKDELSELNERASRFRNACLRFGSNSLEARSAFDRLYYQAAQISSNLNEQTDPQLYSQWEKIRTGALMQIAEILGYKPEKTDQ
jgi:predicted  nucleic acid-binding Zn-ribbon protein